MRGRTTVLLAATALALALPLSRTGHGQDVHLQRVSVSSEGAEANGPSTQPALSADGRYVAFASDSSNLAKGDTLNRDVFVHDRMTGTTELASITTSGVQRNGPSFFPAISGDGRYVAFQSDATNLVPGDTNDATDVYLHDRTTGASMRVSVATDGSQGNGDSIAPSISADGRYVTFTSVASNLVPGDSNNDHDVFMRDLVAGTTELASVASDGTQGNSSSGGFGAGPARISADGRFIVFGSIATNLVANDTNGWDDIFLRDLIAGTTERVSIATDGTQGNGHSMYGSVSDDGRFVAFFAVASNLVEGDTNATSDVFCRDRLKGITIRLSEGPGGVQGDGPSRFPVVGGDGAAIAFPSAATNLISGDANAAMDIFLYQTTSGSIERASVADGGGEANGGSTSAALSSDSGVVAFQSDATNLVPGDTNAAADVFAQGKALTPATATPTPPPATVTPTPTSQGRIGDVNADQRVDSIDALLILQYIAGLLPAPPGGSLSDVNGDGQTNAIDAALVLQYVAGLLGQLPP